MSIDGVGRHLDWTTIEAYGAATLDIARETDVEMHLIDCTECVERVADGARRGLLVQAAPDRLDRVRAGVIEVMHAPRLGLAERLLRTAGVRDEDARLLAATPSLRLPWMLGIVMSLGFAILAAGAGRQGVSLFLALAPIIPVAGVVGAYGPHTDPAHELAGAAPYSAIRLLLLRATVVLVTTIPVVLIGGLVLPDTPSWVAAAWLLPGLTFTVLTLVAGTYTDPLWTAVAIATAWVTLVAIASNPHSHVLSLVDSGSQLAFLAVLVPATAVLFTRRDVQSALRRSR